MNLIESARQLGSVIDVDCWLYVIVAFFGAVTAVLGSNDASTFIDVKPLFYARSTCAVVTATALSLKMYRSTKFAERQQPPPQPTTNPPP